MIEYKHVCSDELYACDLLNFFQYCVVKKCVHEFDVVKCQQVLCAVHTMRTGHNSFIDAQKSLALILRKNGLDTRQAATHRHGSSTAAMISLQHHANLPQHLEAIVFRVSRVCYNHRNDSAILCGVVDSELMCFEALFDNPPARSAFRFSEQIRTVKPRLPLCAK